MRTTTLAPFRTGVQKSAADGFIAGLTARLVKFAEYRRTLAELRALADWQLRDIGLDRRDLRTRAHAATYGN